MAVVSDLAFWTIVSGGAAAFLILGRVVVKNRNDINTLFQRLFGAEPDERDVGYIIEMDRKLDDLRESMESDHAAVMDELKKGD
jgi:hypothetical protein